MNKKIITWIPVIGFINGLMHINSLRTRKISIVGWVIYHVFIVYMIAINIVIAIVMKYI